MRNVLNVFFICFLQKRLFFEKICMLSRKKRNHHLLGGYY